MYVHHQLGGCGVDGLWQGNEMPRYIRPLAPSPQHMAGLILYADIQMMSCFVHLMERMWTNNI